MDKELSNTVMALLELGLSKIYDYCVLEGISGMIKVFLYLMELRIEISSKI